MATATPQPSPLPIRHNRAPSPSEPETSQPHPIPNPHFPPTKLRLKALDLNHPASRIFFENCNPSKTLSTAVETVLVTLYKKENPDAERSTHVPPPTRSVTLHLRSMPGVAYTTGSSLDDDHKEIHLSLDYINGISSTRQRDEINGVLVHEMVHCWQWDALGTAPAGLIEGIADFVRLKAGLSPPHWKRTCDGDWDAGYQHTGYFLAWIQDRFGEGSVKRINEGLRGKEYVQEEFWKGLFGKDVTDLWAEYSKSFEEIKSPRG